MSDDLRKPPPTELDLLRAENTVLKIKVSGLEADVRLKDQEITHLRFQRRKMVADRQVDAVDKFRRTLGSR
jgi:hypothetical protein